MSGWSCWLKGGVGKQPEGFFVLFPELMALNYDQLIEKNMFERKRKQGTQGRFWAGQCVYVFHKTKKIKKVCVISWRPGGTLMVHDT